MSRRLRFCAPGSSALRAAGTSAPTGAKSNAASNLTRRDGEEFLRLAAHVPVRTTVVPYPLALANEALGDLEAGRVQGAAVLVVS